MGGSFWTVITYPQDWVSIPLEAMMHFLPLFQIPPGFRKNLKISDSKENFPNFPYFTFRKQFSDFHSQKFRMTFFQYIFPQFAKIIFSLLLQISPSDLIKFTCFLHAFCFSFPPTLAMMHLCIRTMHVLDAPPRTS